MAVTSRGRRALLVAFGVLQNTLVGGIVFGWASVSGTLLIASEKDGGAGLTMDQTTTIFAVAASISFLSSLVLGFVLDIYGPRIASFVSNVIIGVGCQVFASAHSYWAFAIGASLMAFGGPGIQSSLVHLANLYPESQFLVMSCVTGSITFSFAILPVFDVLWQKYGIACGVMFQSYVLVVLLSAIGSLLLWPDVPFQMEDATLEKTMLRKPALEPTPEEEYVRASMEHPHLKEEPLDSFLRSNSRHSLDRHESFALSKKAMEKGKLSLVSLKDLPFKQQVVSGCFVRILAVFVVTSFFANFYVASITTELADDNLLAMDEQHEMARTFTMITASGIFGSFLVGWMMDQIGLEACTLVTLLLGQLHMLIIIFFDVQRSMMMVGFLIYTLFRQFLFPVFIACLSARLGFKYFGILSGLGFAISGVAQLYIAEMVHVTQGTCHVASTDDCDHGSWRQLHVIQLVLLCGLGFVPIWDHREKEGRQRQVQHFLGSESSIKASSKYGAMGGSFGYSDDGIEI